jgi:hypothetical protein
MIKMTGTINGRETLILGLSDGNLKRLREGKPIHIFGAEMSLGIDVIIFWGETEKKLVAMVGPLIGPDTRIHDQVAKKKN